MTPQPYAWPNVVVTDWHLEQCNCGVICYVPGRPSTPSGHDSQRMAAAETYP